MAKCVNCGETILFEKRGAKWWAISADGRGHWETCRKKPKECAVRMKTSGVIVGRDYKPDGCDCGLPPWELCSPDCEHSIRTPYENYINSLDAQC